MESHLARIANNILVLLILSFVGWIVYVKIVKQKTLDFSDLVGKINFRGK